MRWAGHPDDPGLFRVLVGDGRPLIALTAVCLAIAGGFAVFLSMVGEFLPHDAAFLGLSARDLCEAGGCRVVGFMFHDRVAFGGTLIAIGALYLWLAVVPLRGGEAWAWWVLAISGGVGFASFLAYLGYGYLDTWHGVATLALLPIFVAGLVMTWRRLPQPRGIGALARPPTPPTLRTQAGLGHALVLLSAAGTTVAGFIVLGIGATTVFVTEDLAFMGTAAADLASISPRLVPLIAHDRAGFGGGLATTGLAAVGVAWCATASRSAWQALAVAGVAGFGAALGVHAAVSYTELTHVGPAVAGAIVFVVGLALWRPPFGSTGSEAVPATRAGSDT
jgi:hypothetical protein